MKNGTQRIGYILAGSLVSSASVGFAQIDPIHRNLLELGYDQAITGQGPQAAYIYYYFNNPDFISTNAALRLAVAPVYADGELGFKHLLSPNTDLGLGIYAGAYGDNYYEVRQGNYLKDQSFDGSGGGTALSVYHRFNPNQLIPLNLIARAGVRYSLFDKTGDTSSSFDLPEDRITGFIRTGLRLAGKEPVLYPELGFELSAWFQREWRSGVEPFGFNGDRDVSAASTLYWLYGGINYSWTNIGHSISFAVTAGGSSGADRFSAWRLGGVLPLISEFPLILPGYYYEELTATRFVHLYGHYSIPLEKTRRLRLMVEGASACLEYLPGFEQQSSWQSGAGVGLGYKSKNDIFSVVVRYGYAFNAIRGENVGAQSVGLLFQLDFEAWKKLRHSQ